MGGFVEPVEGLTVIRLAPCFLSLLHIPLHILESRLETVEVALEFLELPAGDDEIVPTESVGGSQFAGHVSLLAAALLAVDPPAACPFLFRQVSPAPSTPGLGCAFRHVTNATDGEGRLHGPRMVRSPTDPPIAVQQRSISAQADQREREPLHGVGQV